MSTGIKHRLLYFKVVLSSYAHLEVAKVPHQRILGEGFRKLKGKHIHFLLGVANGACIYVFFSLPFIPFFNECTILRSGENV